MKFFLDTACIKEISEAAATGLIDGVTTNPTLLAKEVEALYSDPTLRKLGGVDIDGKIVYFSGQKDKDSEIVLKKICKIVPGGDISAEVISTSVNEIVVEAKRLRNIADNIVVKIPITWSGIEATRILSQEGIPVNNTLCFSANQALLAAKAGAKYVSPFVGRLDDIANYGMELIKAIKTIYRNYGFTTKIIVASVRHPMHVLESALCGADVATMPYSVFQKLIEHPLTDKGLDIFMKDWQKLKK